MPSRSKTQQRLMGQALAYKRGEIKTKDMDPKYADEIKSVAKSMSEKQLRDFAKTKHKNLPEKVQERIKSFENFINEEVGFDFSQTLPITTKNFLTNYYSCDECDGLWKVYNKQEDKCKFCGSSEVEDMSEVDWYEIANQRMGNEDDFDLEEERKSEADEAVDLVNLKKGK